MELGSIPRGGTIQLVHSVKVAPQILILSVKVRILVGLPCSHSIMVLHYIGNVETLDRNQVGAPLIRKENRYVCRRILAVDPQKRTIGV